MCKQKVSFYDFKDMNETVMEEDIAEDVDYDDIQFDVQNRSAILDDEQPVS